MNLRPLLLACLLLSPVASSAPATVGESLPAFTLKDEQGKEQRLTPQIKRLYINADRKGDALMAEAMKGLGQAALDTQHAAVVAEISAAPFFVKSIIRGSLKDRGYRTWLDGQGETKKFLPYSADAVTVLELDAQRITAIRPIREAAALRREFVAEPAPGTK